MNIPNRITIFRIMLIPLFLIIMLVPFGWGEITLLGAVMPVEALVGALIFIFAASTDWVDGHYARKHNLVTNLGKFLDPLADKLLVTAALLVLVEMQFVPSWMAFIIIFREFAVTGLRLVAASEGEVLAAAQMGKIKMWTQIIAISALLLHNIGFAAIGLPFDRIALWVAIIFTVLSGWDYFAKNKQILLSSK
ncbi:CDP-diacylglycerol--glycerol-3-phosphate 3-phosphatidyltransferase [Bacillus marinisedimentorum]|uniref:CDP-diacylglycerol--glycerol-3-phosphate 3-phosphatidyltransferase n=1 Tax=Bacillus marinisedimentorum TaxID=1821260 RepID=UPI0007E26E35|nr:CDP-diacylglycerol--glycerol-3-phosphate 3-phosphatidyltransferase [Bacillus marinisedimentorum]